MFEFMPLMNYVILKILFTDAELQALLEGNETDQPARREAGTRQRRVYKCTVCGKPKRGHTCSGDENNEGGD